MQLAPLTLCNDHTAGAIALASRMRGLAISVRVFADGRLERAPLLRKMKDLRAERVDVGEYHLTVATDSAPFVSVVPWGILVSSCIVVNITSADRHGVSYRCFRISGGQMQPADATCDVLVHT